MTDPVTSVKIAGIVSFFCLTTVSSIAPLLINRVFPLCLKCNKERMHTILSHVFKVLRGFAGGVMLATGLLHLLPEANDMITDSITHLASSPKPYNGTLVALAQLLNVRVISLYSGSLRSLKQVASSSGNVENKVATFPWAMLLCGISMISLFMLDVLFTRFMFHKHSSEASTTNKECDNPNHQHEKVNACCVCNRDVFKKILSQCVLWFSLCVHTFSASLAFGIESDEGKVFTLFGAIIGHHLVEAFSYGVILDKNLGKHAWWALLFYALTYSALLPVGIGIGMAISTAEHNDVLVLIQGLIMAIATGAFLYVALFEVLMEHNHGHDENEEKRKYDAIASPASPSIESDAEAEKAASRRLVIEGILTTLRFALFCLGFAIMAVVAIWV